MITYSNIVSNFKAWVDAHPNLETFSYGQPTASDLDKYELYPLAHLHYMGADYGERSKTYRLELYLLDGPPVKAGTTGQQQVDSVSHMEQVAEDLIVHIRKEGRHWSWTKYQYALAGVGDSPLERTTTNELCGTLVTLAITVPYLNDHCNLPL